MSQVINMKNQGKSIRNLSKYRRLTSYFRTLPDFFILGARKAGTTSLYQYLIETPWICSSLYKEVQFFNMHFNRGLNWYKGNFPTFFYKNLKRIQTGYALSGEASADYLFHPRSFKLISQFVPKAKFIVLLRNPIDRAYSDYFMGRNQFQREPLSFEDAIKEEEKRIKGEKEKLINDENYYSWNWQSYTYLARGIYVEQLKKWMSVFPREKFMILTTEEFKKQPKKKLNEILKFLDLPNWQLNKYEMYNSRKYPPMKKETREFLKEYFKPYNEDLYKFLKSDFGW